MFDNQQIAHAIAMAMRRVVECGSRLVTGNQMYILWIFLLFADVSCGGLLVLYCVTTGALCCTRGDGLTVISVAVAVSQR